MPSDGEQNVLVSRPNILPKAPLAVLFQHYTPAVIRVVLAALVSIVRSKVRRVMYPTATTTTLSQNGIRHPHDNNWSSGSLETGRNTAVARMSPAWVPLKVK